MSPSELGNVCTSKADPEFICVRLHLYLMPFVYFAFSSKHDSLHTASVSSSFLLKVQVETVHIKTRECVCTVSSDVNGHGKGRTKCFRRSLVGLTRVIAECNSGVVVREGPEVFRFDLNHGGPRKRHVVLHQRLSHGLLHEQIDVRHLRDTRARMVSQQAATSRTSRDA